MDKKKIAIISRDLNVGGIQRSLINFLKNLDFKKYDIDLYLYNDNIFYKENIFSNINMIYLKPRNSFIKILPFNIIKKLSKGKLNNVKYDYAIDYDGYQTDTALDVILSDAKIKICWIHQDFLLKSKYEKKYAIMHYFMKTKYKYYDKFVCVSSGIIDSFEKLNKIKIKNICYVIPNYINSKDILKESQEKCDLKVDSNKYNFVSVGRLCYAKGYDILLNYLKELTKYRQDFHFYLIGDGTEKEKLLEQIKTLELSNFVTLLGKKSNPFKYEKLMDGFILTSRYEGQGMVLWEAKVLGLELFISKNLEKYNDGLEGYNDLVKQMYIATKKNKKTDDLKLYNEKINEKVNEMLS